MCSNAYFGAFRGGGHFWRVTHIFSRIWFRVIDAETFYVSTIDNNKRTNRINWYMQKDLSTQKCLLGLDARYFKLRKKIILSLQKFDKII